MSHSWDSIQPRAEDLWLRGWEGGNDGPPSSVVNAAQGFNFYGNTSSAFVNELKFAAAKSVRQSIVVLASFNVIAAVGVICGVLWDSIVAARKDDPKFKFRPWSLWIIGPAEVFPFILSIGIAVQSIMFAVVQSKGLKSLMILGCESLSQTTLAALFIVPLIQLVFALEASIRSFLKKPFAPRPLWLVPSLIGIVIASLLVMFGLTHLARPPNYCFASLMWFVERWGEQCFGLIVGICATLIIGGVAIFLRLVHSANIEPTERLAASRMIYYMFAALLANGLLLPYFYNISFQRAADSDITPAQLGMVATVVVNLSGIITGGLYLFLRSSRFSTIGPFNYESSEHQRRTRLGIQIRRSSNSGFSNSGFMSQMAQPVSPSNLYANAVNDYERPYAEKTEEERIESPRESQATTLPATAWIPPKTHKVSIPAPPPGLSATQRALLSPATAAALLPPPPGIMAHRRDSSVGSHATVQIGLRLSNVDDVPNRVPQQPDQPGKVHELGCPKAQHLGSVSSRATTPLRTTSSTYSSAPSPMAASPEEDTSEDLGIRLSPTVYSPNDEVRPLQLKSPPATADVPAALRVSRPWPVSRDAPSELNAPPKSKGWI